MAPALLGLDHITLTRPFIQVVQGVQTALVRRQWFLNFLSSQPVLPVQKPKVGLTKDSRTTGSGYKRQFSEC